MTRARRATTVLFVVASVGRSLVPPRPDDGHTTLAWDDGLGSFVGQEVAGERAWRLGLVPEGLTLVVLAHDGVVHRRELVGLTRAAARAWIDEQALAQGAPPGRLTFEAPYAMPPHSVGAGGGDEAPSIGLGLSPGDEGIPEPYFYVTPWPPPRAGETLPDLAAPPVASPPHRERAQRNWEKTYG